MNICMRLSTLILASAAPLHAQSVPAVTGAPPGELGIKVPAYYVAIPQTVMSTGDSTPPAIAMTGCMQYRAPELSVIRCKLEVGPSVTVMSFSGHIEFKDRDGKVHRHDFNSSNNVAWKPGHVITQKFDGGLEDYEVASYQWFLDGYTTDKGETTGSEPPKIKNEPDAIDTVCLQRGYKKKK